MTKYASFVNETSINPVTGYYDTELFDYGSNLPQTRLELTDEQWAMRVDGPFAVEVTDSGFDFVRYTHPVPELTLAQQAAVALANGVSIVSTSHPQLNGIYAMTPEIRADVTAEMVSLMVNQTFTNGTTAIAIGDTANNTHMLTADVFPTFAAAYGKHAGALRQVQITNEGTLPPQPVTIP